MATTHTLLTPRFPHPPRPKTAKPGHPRPTFVFSLLKNPLRVKPALSKAKRTTHWRQHARTAKKPRFPRFRPKFPQRQKPRLSNSLLRGCSCFPFMDRKKLLRTRVLCSRFINTFSFWQIWTDFFAPRRTDKQTHKHTNTQTNRQTHTQTDIQTLVFRVFSAPDFFFFGKYLSIPKSKYIFGKARPGAINPAFQKKKWTKIRRVFGAKILEKKKTRLCPPSFLWNFL